MNMMSEMFADMLKKAIPPEVAAMLTEEKLKEFGEKANAFVSDLRMSLDQIKETQAAHTLAFAEIRSAIDDNGSGRTAGKRSKSNGAGDSLNGTAGNSDNG
jgi:hypothetical protein